MRTRVWGTRLRAGMVSVLTTGLDVGLFSLCTLCWASVQTLAIARGLCSLCGALANFLLNRLWSFGAKQQNPWKQACRYTMIVLVAIILASTLWWLLMKTFQMDPRLTHVLCLVVVWLTFSFPLMRTWVFRTNS